MPMYDFDCPKCQEEFSQAMTISEYGDSQVFECPQCQHPCDRDDRIITAASVTRASFVDGTKRPGFAERREALSLKTASYDMKSEDRKEIRKTIKEIERKS